MTSVIRVTVFFSRPGKTMKARCNTSAPGISHRGIVSPRGRVRHVSIGKKNNGYVRVSVRGIVVFSLRRHPTFYDIHSPHTAVSVTSGTLIYLCSNEESSWRMRVRASFALKRQLNHGYSPQMRHLPLERAVCVCVRACVCVARAPLSSRL